MIESKTSNLKKLYSLSYEHVFFQIHKLRTLWKMIITYDVTYDVTSPPPTTTTEQEHIQKYQTSKLIRKIENNLN